MMYNVGEQVVIVSSRSKRGTADWNPVMDKWFGRTMTIKEIEDDIYRMEEDKSEHNGIGWAWCDEMIDHEATAALHNPELKFTDPYDVDYYTDKVMKALDNFDRKGILMSDDIQHSRIGIIANVRAWYKNKKPLFALLRKHPLWNEEAKAVVYLNTEHRLPDEKDAKAAFDKLIYECFNSDIRKLIESEHSDMTGDEYDEMIRKSGIRKTGYFLSGKDEVVAFTSLFKILFFSETMNVMTEQTANAVNTLYPDIKAKVGQKASRVANKIFCKFGFDKTAEYNRCFAKLADTMNPFDVERITVLSVNFMDYLLMSNGNSWSSCHTILENSGSNYGGCYKGGTLSYANDSESLIFYTLDKNYTGTDYCLEPKICRQVFFWDYPVLVQERLYPQCNDDTEQGKTLVKQYRQIVEGIFAEALCKPNLWVKENHDHARITARRDTFMYHDWSNFTNYIVHLKQEITVSENETEDINDTEIASSDNNYVIRSAKHILVGGTSYCTCCGNERREYDMDTETAQKTLLCDNCSDNIVCADCGRDYRLDDLHYINGEYYCDDCCFYCEYHEEWETGDYEYVDRYGDVCRDALDYSGNFGYCEDCEKWYFSEDMFLVHDKYGDEIQVCESCFENYSQCDECGEYFYYTQEIDGCYYCDKCAESIREEMKNSEEETA